MARYAVLAALALSAIIRADTLVMKSGEKYQLKAPATHKNGRVTFTTTEDRLLSVKESEIAQEIAGPPPRAPKRINRTDSRQLGAYAREQNEQKGKVAPVTGKATDKKTSDEASREIRSSAAPKKKKKAPRDSPPPPPAAKDQ